MLVLTLLYIFIPELIPLILDKLIDRIEIGSLKVADGVKTQEIGISWRFVGGLE